MNRYEVMASEEGSPKRLRRDEILYQISLFGRPAHLIYRFYEDRLVGARYVLPLKAVDTLEKIGRLVSLRYGTSKEVVTAHGPSMVWRAQGRTIRLFVARRGQAVIDLVPEEAEVIPSRRLALLRQSTFDAVIRNL